MKFKKVLSFILAAAMVAGMLSALSFTSLAEEPEVSVEVQNTSAEPVSEPEDVMFDTVSADAFLITFAADAHASVTVYDTQETANGTENAGMAYARNSDTGELDVSGDGQVNFQIVPEDGYTVLSVTAEPTDNYKNLKTVDTDSFLYRVTKIQGDVTVTVVTEQIAAEEETEEADGTLKFTDISSEAEHCFAAAYDANGYFLAMKIATLSGTTAVAEFDETVYAAAATVKLFILDGNYCPVAEARILQTGTSGTDTGGTETPVTEDEGDGIIHLNGTSVDATGVANVTVDGTTVTITAAGAYSIEGTLSDGQIAVAAAAKTDAVILNLTNVSVTCSTGNALDATKGCVTLANTAGSTSSFISTYGADTDAGAGIYCKNDLTIKGADSASTIIAKSTAGNGIRCKADLEIGTGNLEVEAGNHGIKGDESVKFTKKTGTVTVTAGGDAIKTDAIDSDTLELDTDSSYAPKGTITVNGGTFNLTAGGDGFQADYGFICANSPVITIVSGAEGIKANTSPVDAWYYTDSTLTTTATVQGFVQIDGGTMHITSSEDGIKAADYVNITGGSITVVSTLDGIQSGVDYTDANGKTAYTNGNLAVTGGTLNITTHGGATGTATEDSCKGIKAVDALVISDGSFTLNCYDDAIHSNYTVTITGGDFEIATADDGVHADYYLTLGTEGGADDDFTMNISTSYEGVEGSVIAYLSGTTTLYATDDGVNAAGDYEENGTYHAQTSSGTSTQTGTYGGGRPGNPGGGGFGPNPGTDDSSDYGMLYIKGGKLYLAANGDGLDSNGSILMSGGVVVVNGTTRGGNGVFDIGDTSGSYFKVTGGTLVGFGTTDMKVTPTVTGQSYLNTTTSLTKGSTKNVLVASGVYMGIVPEITLSSAMLFVTTPDMTSSRAVYSGSVSYNAANRLLGRTVGSTFYGVSRSDYDNTAG